MRKAFTLIELMIVICIIAIIAAIAIPNMLAVAHPKHGKIVYMYYRQSAEDTNPGWLVVVRPDDGGDTYERRIDYDQYQSLHVGDTFPRAEK